MGNTDTIVDVANKQIAQFRAPEAVMEEGRQNRAITFAFERLRWRCFEQRSGLAITERGCFAFIAIDSGPFYAPYRIVADCVLLTKVIEQRCDGGKLSADSGC